MEITNVQIIKVVGKEKLLAYANVVINNAIVLKGIKLIDGSRGKFITMPIQRLIRKKEIKVFEFYHPINNDARDLITKAIIAEYEKIEE